MPYAIPNHATHVAEIRIDFAEGEPEYNPICFGSFEAAARNALPRLLEERERLARRIIEESEEKDKALDERDEARETAAQCVRDTDEIYEALWPDGSAHDDGQMRAADRIQEMHARIVKLEAALREIAEACDAECAGCGAYYVARAALGERIGAINKLLDRIVVLEAALREIFAADLQVADHKWAAGVQSAIDAARAALGEAGGEGG